MTLFQKMIQAMKSMLGKSIDYDKAYWFQCLDYIRWYADYIWKPIWTFSGSAYNGWQTGSPFKGTTWKRVEYKKWTIAPRWSIIFFDKVKGNPYGHVAIVQNANINEVEVSEQNAGTGNGNGIWGNAITLRKKTYATVLGWYELP